MKSYASSERLSDGRGIRLQESRTSRCIRAQVKTRTHKILRETRGDVFTSKTVTFYV